MQTIKKRINENHFKTEQTNPPEQEGKHGPYGHAWMRAVGCM